MNSLVEAMLKLDHAEEHIEEARVAVIYCEIEKEITDVLIGRAIGDLELAMRRAKASFAKAHSDICQRQVSPLNGQ